MGEPPLKFPHERPRTRQLSFQLRFCRCPCLLPRLLLLLRERGRKPLSVNLRAFPFTCPRLTSRASSLRLLSTSPPHPSPRVPKPPLLTESTHVRVRILVQQAPHPTPFLHPWPWELARRLEHAPWCWRGTRSLRSQLSINPSHSHAHHSCQRCGLWSYRCTACCCLLGKGGLGWTRMDFRGRRSGVGAGKGMRASESSSDGYSIEGGLGAW